MLEYNDEQWKEYTRLVDECSELVLKMWFEADHFGMSREWQKMKAILNEYPKDVITAAKKLAAAKRKTAKAEE